MPALANQGVLKMAKYRNNLPQLSGDLFLTDGGLETTLMFHDGYDLPEFAAFPLHDDEKGTDSLRKYYETYAAIARESGQGFILETATWRASSDWAKKLGYSTATLAAANRKSVALMEEIRERFESDTTSLVISGNIGPRGDGYDPKDFMSADEAQSYHTEQIETFRTTNVDMVSAITITYAQEVIGITRAAQAADLPVVISFTVETDGRLPDGQNLKEAIEAVDAATDSGPVYYGINCAHPTHYEEAITTGEAWVSRIRSLRSNASAMSHSELDEAEELDDGNPVELGDQHRQLRQAVSHINILGGCCGTDHRHIEETSKACSH